MSGDPSSCSNEMANQNASLSSAHNASNSNSEGLDNATRFECNICIELAQDPVVTLCGHLYCWRCLYTWLHIRADSHECPVCKARIEKEKLVPLYGRGKPSSGPITSTTTSHMDNLPQRPTGLRPVTVTPAAVNPLHQQGGVANVGEGTAGLGGSTAVHSITAGVGNMTASSSGFGGIFPAMFPFLFNLHVHGFNDATVYGTTSGFPHGFFYSFHGGLAPGFHQQHAREVVQSYSPIFAFGLIFLALVLLMSVIW